MKIVKHYWFIAIALITMISFSSCENDEERGYNPQIEMFARFKMKSSFHKTKRII